MKVVSTIKYPKSIPQVQALIEPWIIVFKAIIPIIYPKNRLPESPIKIEAGGKLNTKKPKQTVPSRRSTYLRTFLISRRGGGADGRRPRGGEQRLEGGHRLDQHGGDTIKNALLPVLVVLRHGGGRAGLGADGGLLDLDEERRDGLVPCS